VAFNWEIVPQEIKDKQGNVSFVDLKTVKFFPTKRKAKDGTEENGFGKLSSPVLSFAFKHVKDDGVFKITARKQRDKWFLKLHEPVRTKPVMIKTPNRATCLEMRHPAGLTREVRDSSPSLPENLFWKRLTERVKDIKFLEIAKEVITEGMQGTD
jgi:hypothetical protein